MDRYVELMREEFGLLRTYFDKQFNALQKTVRVRLDRVERDHAKLKEQVARISRRKVRLKVVSPKVSTPPPVVARPSVVVFHRQNIHHDRQSREYLESHFKKLTWEHAHTLGVTRWRAGKKVPQSPRCFEFFVDEHCGQAKYANVALVGTRVWTYASYGQPWQAANAPVRFLKSLLDEFRDVYLRIMKSSLEDRNGWASCFRPHHDALSRKAGHELLSVANYRQILHRYMHLAQANRKSTSTLLEK